MSDVTVAQVLIVVVVVGSEWYDDGMTLDVDFYYYYYYWDYYSLDTNVDFEMMKDFLMNFAISTMIMIGGENLESYSEKW